MKRYVVLFFILGGIQSLSANATENRKFPASTFLHGLANTCNQLSNAAGAETDKEKKQAALGVIGSIFSLAGNVTAEQEKERAEEKAGAEKRLADIAICLLEVAEKDESYKKELTRLPILGMIGKLPTRSHQKAFLSEHVTSSHLVKPLVEDVVSLAAKIVVNQCRSSMSFRSGDEELALEGKQSEEVDEKVVGLAKAIWLFLVELYNKENITGHLKEQVGLLFDFVREKVTTFFISNHFAGNKDSEEVEETAAS